MFSDNYILSAAKNLGRGVSAVHAKVGNACRLMLITTDAKVKHNCL